MFRTVLAFSLAASAAASCDNSCSGHGVCNCGFCLCYDNWGMNYDLDTGDCSDRICPFEFAWVDTPDKNGRHHKYAECANKGICNRQTGECECFPGYEGKACHRTSCPNDCSGHGTCEYIEDLVIEPTPFSSDSEIAQGIATIAGYPVPGGRYYQGTSGYFTHDMTHSGSYASLFSWDVHKTRGCVCDPEYGDVDCSKRMCQYGNDMMDRRQNYYQTTFGGDVQASNLKYQVQNIWFQTEHIDVSNEGRTFALRFKSKLNETFTTVPIVFNSAAAALSDFVDDITGALQNLPNGVIDAVEVHAYLEASNEVHVNITFVGDYVQGEQNIIQVIDYKCGDGCTPQTTGINLSVFNQDRNEVRVADYNSYECGRRGKCDYDTGLCECFEGFTGPACNACTAMI